MREIKFRAWDKCNERMVEPRNILKICMSRLNQEPYLIVYLKKWMNENREIKESDKSYTNEFELMQYTGLKDRNGKEIYEGDICRYKCGKTKWIEEVVFFHGSFTFPVSEEPLGRHRHIFNILEEELEIIGNIYENPELLE